MNHIRCFLKSLSRVVHVIGHRPSGGKHKKLDWQCRTAKIWGCEVCHRLLTLPFLPPDGIQGTFDRLSNRTTTDHLV
ncbi:hypothetical protein NP493_265g01035 [Ridgeia piscesae]|uniref:Uncharacterized protein n=1 Tax=Ridgeia piscesae TaxID=27915 RepID=A0AAD9NXS4_RIDPI|nr:hypothetical protein NP493_265g01035 [Ridgeia piscesae]